MSEQSPQGPVGWQPDGPSGPRASFGRRLAAYLLDGILLLVVYGIALVVFNESVALALYALGAIAYYILLVGGPTGQTLGKKWLGIRVVDFNTGGSIGYGRAAVRFIASLLSSLPCYLGYFWMLWDKEKQTWHDKLSTSISVPESYYPVNA